MFKRNTWFLLALFAALAGFAVYLNYKPETETPDADATPPPTAAPIEYLFPAQEEEPTSLLIESREGEAVRLERGENGWALTRPLAAEANQGSVEAAISQLAALSVVTRLELDPADVGLQSPAYTITVGFSSGRFIRARIGDETPTGTGYYVRKDEGNILVINKYGLDALLDMLKSPPYLASPTPSSLPTETPIPTVTETPLPAEPPTATKTP